jgi:ERO1-like protein alpha
VNSEALLKACPIPFHEGRLWKGEDAPALRQQLQASFQNITSIMDCVGCEKCKLWGKLQLLGECHTSRKLVPSYSLHEMQPRLS